MTPENALALCHFLQDFAAMMLWGGLGYLEALRPSPLANALGDKLNLPIMVAVALAAIATLILLPVEAANLGDGWADVVNPSILKSLLIETNIGPICGLQALAVAALIATLLRKSKSQFFRTVISAGLLLGVHALEGHSVMRDGLAGYALQLSYLVHVLSAGAWLGALLALVLILWQSRNEPLKTEPMFALRRFSRLGQIIVALILLTGIANTSLISGQWPTQWSQPYQFLFSLKLLLVATMIGIAIFNHYVLLPQMKSAKAFTILPLFWATFIELCCGIAVLGLVGVFSMLDPI